MYLAAVSDVHSPRYFTLFQKALSEFEWEEVGLFIMAGDMVLRGRAKEYGRIINAVRKRYKGEMVAVFGNEEYEEVEEMILRDYGEEVRWLNDEGACFKLDGLQVFIYGTRGVLDTPTPWQRKHIPDINFRYERRVREMTKWLEEVRDKGDLLIVVSHYAVTYKTMIGERKSIWPMLGSKRIEEVLLRLGVDIAIHGHVHGSKVIRTNVGKVRIYNVALMAVGGITKIELKKSKDIMSYF